MRPGIVSIVALAITAFCAGRSGVAGPEEDREHMLRFYREKFPTIPVADYVLGALALDPGARAQYEEIMTFPPFDAVIDRGKLLWETPFRNGRRYEDCFSDGGAGAAATYPRFDDARAKVVTFEMALNDCRTSHGEAPYAHGDRATMGTLTAYARGLSDGFPMTIRVEGAAALAAYNEGKRFYFTRRGQLNFACASCHQANAGAVLRTEILSMAIGQATHWPVFRAGENLNTLHMRYIRCLEQIRAVPFPAGSVEFNQLEYFHSYLSNGLPLKASVFRK